jgi:hypothetical protein
MCKKKMLNEGNQIHNFISSSGSGTVINCGSGSDFLTNYGMVPVPVPVPKGKKLRFLRFRFRFHNTGCGCAFLSYGWGCALLSYASPFLAMLQPTGLCLNINELRRILKSIMSPAHRSFADPYGKIYDM